MIYLGNVWTTVPGELVTLLRSIQEGVDEISE